MPDYESDGSDDTVSAGYAFDMPQHNLRGLRIFVGPRRAASVDFDGDGFPWRGWLIGHEADIQVGEGIDLGLDRGYIGRRSHVARPMGQAVNLALCIMETQKSINIMAAVAQRLVAELPGKVFHITPQSTLHEIQTLVRNWLAKLRQHEFFKIQVVHMDDNSAAFLSGWSSFRNGKVHATLANYKPHSAGMLRIHVKIIEKLVHHASSSHPYSHIERQKCLFHVANLIINQVQRHWVHFLMPRSGSEPNPVAVHNEATEGLMDFYGGPSAAYHWDAEFFGGVVQMMHNKANPTTQFNQFGGFGRLLSIGDAYLNRPDGTEQLVSIDSITRCTAGDFSEVLRDGLRLNGARAPAFGFTFLDYRAGSA